jgi:hypothetical protein
MHRTTARVVAFAFAWVSVVTGVGVASQADQPVPRLVKFTGVVAGVQGTVGVTFAFYADQASETPLWSETQQVAVDTTGRYAVYLGASRAEGLPLDLFAMGEARWLGVRVEGREEQPRVLLVSVPYALKAGDAETVGGKPLSAFVLAGDQTGVGADGLTYVDTRVLSSGLTTGTSAAAPGGAGSANYIGVFTDTTTLGNSVIYQTPGGSIGLNTTTPAAAFHAVSGAAPVAYFDVYSNALGALPVVYRAARGTPSAPTAVQTDDILGGLAVRGYGSTGFSTGRGQVMFKAAENWTDTANGTYLQFTTTPLGSASWLERMRIDPSGNVGIGTPTPGQKLSVAGAVESTTGGFRFPDGSVQTTAAVMRFPPPLGTTGVGYGSLQSNTTGANNTATGYDSLGSNSTGAGNSAFGYEALGNNTASNNSAFGTQALVSNTSGTNNSAFGANALWSNTTGFGNTAVGNSALTAATTANGNVAVGDTALGATTTGANNGAFGFHALWKNTIGAGNDGVGYYSLSSNTTGQYNTAMGDTALAGNTTGNTNSALGRWAGLYNATGSNNVYLGYNAGPDSSHAALSNSIAIGANAVVSQSNTMVLGGTGGNGVKVGIGTSTPAQTLSVVGAIESTSGGFVFPDGTTQTTAGPRLSGGSSISATGTTVGLQAVAANGDGLRGISTNGWGTYGLSAYGDGVHGESTNSRGVYGYGGTYGVVGVTSSGAAGNAGVLGIATGNAYGVYGLSNVAAPGVMAENQSSNGGSFGLFARNTGTGSAAKFEVYGQSADGVQIASANPSPYSALDVWNSNASGGIAIHSQAYHGGTAVSATTDSGVGVIGTASDTGGKGVWGETGSGYGVYGRATSNGYGGYFSSATGWAGWFNGNVNVTGVLIKAAGAFRIDHPLDPGHKYLSHSFVESPDMKNIYDGIAVLDAAGEALVTLPDYFEALNKDFRYQLTPIGAAFVPYIAEEIAGNRFRIAGGPAGKKVSWQVTGIRQDAYASANRIVVEEVKPESEQGTFLHPEAFNQPQEKGVGGGSGGQDGLVNRRPLQLLKVESPVR